MSLTPRDAEPERTEATAPGTSLLESVLIALIAVPVLGILMGGVYSVPAMRVAGKRPWLLFALLGGGLAVTTSALALAWSTPLPWVLLQLPVLAVALLLQHRSYGTLDGNLERFGLVHGLALNLGCVLGMLNRFGALPIIQ